MDGYDPLPVLLTPSEIADYLAATGWSITHQDTDYQEWTHPGHRGEFVSINTAPAQFISQAREQVWISLDDLAAAETRSAEDIADDIARAHPSKYHRQVISTRMRVEESPITLARQESPPARVRAEVQLVAADIDTADVVRRFESLGWVAQQGATDGTTVFAKEGFGVVSAPTADSPDAAAQLVRAFYDLAAAEDRPVRDVVRDVTGEHPHTLYLPDPSPPPAAVPVSAGFTAAARIDTGTDQPDHPVIDHDHDNAASSSGIER